MERFIRIVDVTQLNEPQRYVYNPTGKGRVQDDDIFFVRYGAVGTIGYGYNGVIANNLFKVTPTFQASSSFLYQQFANGRFNLKLKELSASTSMPAINFTALNNLYFWKTNIIEQNKIGNFFSVIDKQIEQQENLLTLLNKYKRGLFYHVFLKYDKYKQTKIADLICKYETDVNCKNYLEISDIDIKTNTYKIDINKLAVNGSKKGYQGNIIISTVRPNRGAITILKDNIYISSGFCQLHINNDIANTNFIYQVIKSKKFLNKMQLLTTGTTYPTISQNDILNISIPVPSLEEQNKIANILSTYDNLIDKEKQVLNLLQEMKSGLLQQMFI